MVEQTTAVIEFGIAKIERIIAVWQKSYAETKSWCIVSTIIAMAIVIVTVISPIRRTVKATAANPYRSTATGTYNDASASTGMILTAG